jgi:hypothetical protein
MVKKFLCGTLIEPEQTAEALVNIGSDQHVVIVAKRGREEQLIAFALVWAFEMVMLDELRYCSA